MKKNERLFFAPQMQHRGLIIKTEISNEKPNEMHTGKYVIPVQCSCLGGKLVKVLKPKGLRWDT